VPFKPICERLVKPKDKRYAKHINTGTLLLLVQHNGSACRLDGHTTTQSCINQPNR
jgi:hypothetical protein